MIPPLDIFVLKDNGPHWVASAETIEKALEIVAKQDAGSYLVYSQKTGNRTLYTLDPGGELNAVRVFKREEVGPGPP